MAVDKIGPEQHRSAQSYLRYLLLEKHVGINYPLLSESPDATRRIDALFAEPQPTFQKSIVAIRTALRFNPPDYSAPYAYTAALQSHISRHGTQRERGVSFMEPGFGPDSFYADGQRSVWLSGEISIFAERILYELERQEKATRFPPMRLPPCPPDRGGPFGGGPG